MPVAIVLVPDPGPGSAEELEGLGFRKETVWVKHHSHLAREEAERELFQMGHRPLQFLVSDYWGLGED
jgi:hypothetical protein